MLIAKDHHEWSRLGAGARPIVSERAAVLSGFEEGEAPTPAGSRRSDERWQTDIHFVYGLSTARRRLVCRRAKSRVAVGSAVRPDLPRDLNYTPQLCPLLLFRKQIPSRMA